ncbi:hypothetical protein D7I39_20775 [Allopusillimonas ginsengisoli]|nr:hypothetical protein D7I39_20775 [Allopusillimonas ginsengisoli]
MSIATQEEPRDSNPPGSASASNDPSASKSLPSHYSLKADDVDPELGKTIREIVICSEQFIVYIDKDLCVQWYTTDEHEEPDYCGEVLNLVATLEAQSNFMTDKSMLFDFRKRIGEGLARCLSGYPKETSIAALEEVAVEMRARNKDVSWVWYFQASYWVTLFLAVVFAVSWLVRDWLRPEIGPAAFDVVLGSICGTFGALLSVTVRSNRLTFDANAGKNLHVLEGLARVAVGAIGALLTALGIKAGLILGGTTFSGNQFALLLCLCICAGASERLVPSLVATVERVTSNGRG